MLFNSLEFILFLPVVFFLYWFVTHKKLQTQNFLLLAASYFFYGWWDYRFLSLILFSTLVDYFIGLNLGKDLEEKKRKLLLSASLLINLGFLGVFKYYNFFAESFVDAFSFFGYSFQLDRLSIILPIGISFYTFQTLSYSIDIYRRKLKPTKDFISFAAFVSFFPQLVAGPIERATNLLPQFEKKRTFDYHNSIDGLRQILWGFFKKIVIADNCAIYVNLAFNDYGSYSGSTLLLGAIFFAFQIYGDFSGYSDIAIGTARLFGFKLMQNFAFPYFSRDIAEFWRRWHISLSTWFRDYLYIPLGGSRGGRNMKIRNTFIIFIVSGFWHGANWTFIIWGALNALYFLPLLLSNRNRTNLAIVAEGQLLPSFKDVFNILLTFGLTVIAWIFFRAENLSMAINYIAGIFNTTLFSIPYFIEPNTNFPILPKKIILLILFLLVVEWIGREKKHALQLDKVVFPKVLRWGFYYFLIVIIFTFFQGDYQEFIYFQF